MGGRASTVDGKRKADDDGKPNRGKETQYAALPARRASPSQGIPRMPAGGRMRHRDAMAPIGRKPAKDAPAIAAASRIGRQRLK
jgi:hypothetical protein